MKLRKLPLRRPAWIAGAVTFVLFEALGLVAAMGIASLRCCGAGGRARPQDASEMIGLVVLTLAMVILGLALAAGASLLIECVHRLADRARSGR
jgi:hypothetical protein